MSRVTTWLILIFDDSREEAWFTDPLFDEDHANTELTVLRISAIPGKRERHLRYKLEQPLTSEQLQGLSELKEQRLFKSFYILDEITD
jgi:hypothetical protein